jgi:hypothetical protein
MSAKVQPTRFNNHAGVDFMKLTTIFASSSTKKYPLALHAVYAAGHLPAVVTDATASTAGAAGRSLCRGRLVVTILTAKRLCVIFPLTMRTFRVIMKAFR